MPKGCQGTRTELHEAANLEKLLRTEFDILRQNKNQCRRTMDILDRAILKASHIVAQITRDYYGDNFSHYPDERGTYPVANR